MKIYKKHEFTSDEKLEWWGYGEWVEEPDYVYFVYKEYSCHVRRRFSLDGPIEDPIFFGGYLNGYVVIPRDHPLYAKKGEDLKINCYGGVSFADMFEKVYVVGFDCAHAADIVPSLHKSRKTQSSYESYKNLSFVIKECKSIVNQLEKAYEEKIST
jgi:hypothetical protein